MPLFPEAPAHASCFCPGYWLALSDDVSIATLGSLILNVSVFTYGSLSSTVSISLYDSLVSSVSIISVGSL